MTSGSRDEIKMKTNPKIIPGTDRLFFSSWDEERPWWRACAEPNVLPKEKEKHGIRQTDRNEQPKKSGFVLSQVLTRISKLDVAQQHVCHQFWWIFLSSSSSSLGTCVCVYRPPIWVLFVLLLSGLPMVEVIKWKTWAGHRKPLFNVRTLQKGLNFLVAATATTLTNDEPASNSSSCLVSSSSPLLLNKKERNSREKKINLY